MEALRAAYGWDELTAEDLVEIVATYYGMTSRVDAQLGRVVEAVDRAGELDNTLFVLFTDHGEYLGDFGLVEKWPSGLDPCLTRNPLVIAGPGVSEGGVSDAMVELVDLLPTIAELGDAEVHHTHFGRSLSACWQLRAPSTASSPVARAGSDRPTSRGSSAAGWIYEAKTDLQHDHPELVGTAIALRTLDYTFVYRAVRTTSSTTASPTPPRPRTSRTSPSSRRSSTTCASASSTGSPRRATSSPGRPIHGSPNWSTDTARHEKRVAMSVDHVVVVLLDSLNRHMLGSYGGTEFDTPNLDRFAAASMRFTRHFTGSLPCMPARHDVLCGALDFLWRPWGSIELWEQSDHRGAARRRCDDDARHPTTRTCSRPAARTTTPTSPRGTTCAATRATRGSTYPDPSWLGAPDARRRARAAGSSVRYDLSRTWFRAEDDFPGPRTMAAAATWLTRRGRAARPVVAVRRRVRPPRALRHARAVGGHVRPRLGRRAADLAAVRRRRGRQRRLSEREGRHIRANYGAKLSMIDHWFGRMLDALDAGRSGTTTAVIVCTDHGHYLGEKDIWGKPGVMQYEPLGHMPLLVPWPGVARRHDVRRADDGRRPLRDHRRRLRRRAEHRTHGRSLVPLLDGSDHVRARVGDRRGLRELGAGHRRTRKYARAPVGDNFPLSMWSNRWSTMPVHGVPEPARSARQAGAPRLHARHDVPVIRQPFAPGDALPFWAARHVVDQHHCYDVDLDPDEDEDLVGTRVEREMLELLRAALHDVDAPDEQLARLGLI